MQKLVQTVKRWLIFYVFLNLIFSHKGEREIYGIYPTDLCVKSRLILQARFGK